MNLTHLYSELFALFQVVCIDVVLAGDNAIVVAMAAAGVDPSIRKRVIVWGIAGAVVLRILFAVLTTQLLAVVGLTLAGGVLLLWVSWKMYRELAAAPHQATMAMAMADGAIADADSVPVNAACNKSFGQAMVQIIVADVSMSLDNVLAVAGAAKDHLVVLVIGLVLSVGLMGAAASLISNLLNRFRWIAWVGLAIILYVALEMLWRGSHQMACDGGLWTAICADAAAAKPVALPK